MMNADETSVSIAMWYRGSDRPPVTRTDGTEAPVPGSVTSPSTALSVQTAHYRLRDDLQLGAQRRSEHLARPLDEQGHLVGHQTHVAVGRGEHGEARSRR